MPTEIHDAIRHFWRSKEAAQAKQKEEGKEDAGLRGQLTAGKHLDGFASLLRRIAEGAGIPNPRVITERRATILPGYFRASKEWDLIVMSGDTLVAVFELKSISSSFGNNGNNRAEEAVGSAHDFCKAFLSGVFGNEAPDPFMGFIMVMNDCEKSNRPVRVDEPLFRSHPDFAGASYAVRMDQLCRKLVEDGLYTSAALILSDEGEGAATGSHRALAEDTSIEALIRDYRAHLTRVVAPEIDE